MKKENGAIRFSWRDWVYCKKRLYNKFNLKKFKKNKL